MWECSFTCTYPAFFIAPWWTSITWWYPLKGEKQNEQKRKPLSMLPFVCKTQGVLK